MTQWETIYLNVEGRLSERRDMTDRINHSALSDEELIRDLSDAALTELILRYKKVVEIKAKKLFRQNGSVELNDLIDEGFVAVFYAVRTYDESKGVLFSTYADICITNRMLTSAGRHNRMTDCADEGVSDKKADIKSPEAIYLEKERFDEVMKRVSRELSGMELSVLEMYLQYESCKIIADKLGITEKAADNAMQRVRKKLRTVLRA